MATITINDVEYNTEEFNEEQSQIFQEIQIASAELDRITYTARVLDARRQMLAGMIEEIANKPADGES
jgi:hypothetical protein